MLLLAMTAALAFISIACGAPSHSAIVMPLDAINFEGGPRLTITASPVSSSGRILPAQKLLLDTGSSTLAFCNSSLEAEVKSFQSEYYSCNIYGNSQVREGYWGPFYKGGVAIGNINVPDAYYSIMTQQVSMPCSDSGSVNGIFGIAFHQLDQATSEAPASWPSNGVGSCPRASTDFVQPLMQYLNSQGGTKRLGIYWSGKQGVGEGQLYLDDDATSNSHYDEGAASAMGTAALGEFGWYDITVESVGYGGQSYSDITCNPQYGSPCIMDTGTPVLVIPQGAYDAMVQGRTGELTVTLKGSGQSSKSVELKFDAQILLANNWVEPTPQPGVILGLPLRAFYYTVMDISGQSASFTPMPAYFMKGANSLNATLVV